MLLLACFLLIFAVFVVLAISWCQPRLRRQPIGWLPSVRMSRNVLASPTVLTCAPQQLASVNSRTASTSRFTTGRTGRTGRHRHRSRCRRSVHFRCRCRHYRNRCHCRSGSGHHCRCSAGSGCWRSSFRIPPGRVSRQAPWCCRRARPSMSPCRSWRRRARSRAANSCCSPPCR